MAGPSYILTVTTADRVGIVHAVTGKIRELGGNILELCQTVMRGYFTLILAVEFPEPIDPDTLARSVGDQGRLFDLTVVARPADPNAERPAVADGERFIITVMGTDIPGSIHGIAGCLAEHGVNIVDLHARVDGSIFSVVMEAVLPPDLPPSTVRAELERYGQALGLEAFVQHESIFHATSEPSPVRIARTRQPEGPQVVVPH